MKIDHLMISNFRGISRLEATDLGDTIIIAGQNGSGKSCLFDGIRLLKSTYGGYQQNEWQHFFGEFAIQLHGGSKNLRGLFNDNSKPLDIECHFRLRDQEKAYIASNAAALLEETIWQTLLPEAFHWGGYTKALFANQFRERQPEVTERVQKELPSLQAQLAQPHLVGKVQVAPSGQVGLNPCGLLSVVFTNYKPRQIGVIDFHGSQRHYGRETVKGINLSLDDADQKYGQHTLYNYNNKYNNVKSEMAGDFVKELLAEKAAGVGSGATHSLSETLKELFESFFPEKKFVGPRPTPDGSLAFPVQTANGIEHDLDELSSGEKEILYGYLRIRSSAPRDSIILLDEPELHLNPRLIRGLPEFYRKHLGEALQNQLWLVTHSDALIREAVGKPGFNVFHMLPCGPDAGANQLRPLTVTKDLELVLTDLVGDLAAYRPGGKGLIFEGGGDTDFDKTMAASLFREELRGINLISGSNKIRVRSLHEILERAYERGDLPTKFYAIVDRDTDEPREDARAVNRFEWDVYHIENYLLDAQVISDVVNSLKPGRNTTAPWVTGRLQEAARQVVASVLHHRLKVHVNNRLIGAIAIGLSPDATDASAELHTAVSRSSERIVALRTSDLTASKLAELERDWRQEIEASLADGTWAQQLPGRDILRRFVGMNDVGTKYEMFRNLILSRMSEMGVKPSGMKSVIDKIVND